MKNNRMRFLIYPKLQLSLIFSGMGVLALSYVFIAIQVYRSFHELKGLGEQIGLPAGHPYFEFIQFHEHALSVSLYIAGVISCLVSFVLLLVLSHRVAGPIVRLKGYFEAMSREGWKTRLTFRKGDFFSELPEVINQALEPKAK